MKTCKEMAKTWNVSVRTVTSLCRSGKIPGAIKFERTWQIPDDATKPVDGRITSGKYIKKYTIEKKKLPIGISKSTRRLLLCR